MPTSRYCAAACGGSAVEDRFLDVGAVERRAAERDDAAVDADGRRRAGDQQQIAGAARHQLAQPGVEPGAVAAGGAAGVRSRAAGAAAAGAGAGRRAGAARLVVQLAQQRFEILAVRSWCRLRRPGADDTRCRPAVALHCHAASGRTPCRRDRAPAPTRHALRFLARCRSPPRVARGAGANRDALCICHHRRRSRW